MDESFNLLVLDDDASVLSAVQVLAPKCWKVYRVSDPQDIEYERFFHAAMIDLHLKGKSDAMGMSVVSRLKKSNEQIEIIAMSGDPCVDLMEKSIQAGATRFISKPLINEEALLLLDKIASLWRMRDQIRSGGTGIIRWVGHSKISQEIQRKIAFMKGEQGPFLIEGETGTGKEVVARMLHQQENDRPFIAVNVGSIPDELFESEMFGHVKGSFTGAHSDKVGLIQAANGGDLFLDEIEALPMHQQAKLLRFLELGEIRPVGSRQAVQVETRVIAASNRPLEEMVKSKEFRDDLFFRLNAQRIELPPLRDRLEDIELLASHFTESERPRRNKLFTSDGYEALRSYNWPGNVRELKRICEQLTLTSPLPLIRGQDVRRVLGIRSETPPDVHEILARIPDSQNQFLYKIKFDTSLDSMKEDFEIYCMKLAMDECNNNVEEAARLLKTSRSNMYRKVNKPDNHV
jgi:DNA-binding NtrC family response regulator